MIEFLQNKYTKVYYQIVDRSQNRSIKGYTMTLKEFSKNYNYCYQNLYGSVQRNLKYLHWSFIIA